MLGASSPWMCNVDGQTPDSGLHTHNVQLITGLPLLPELLMSLLRKRNASTEMF